MNFLNLQYFLVLAEELSFSKAAKRLFISQQSLSTHIRKLELEFGVPLFDRGVPLRLTEGGRQFLTSAKAILEEKNNLEKQLIDLRDFRKGDVTIGVPWSRGAFLMPPLITSFQKQFPQVCIHLFEGTTNEVTDALYSGMTDLTIGFEISDEKKIESHPLYLETMKIVVPNEILTRYFGSSQALREQETLPISVFSHCPFVGLHRNTMIGELLYGTFERDGLKPNVVIEAVNVFTMLSLCCAGVGVCLCPNSFLNGRNSLISRDLFADVTIFPVSNQLGSRWISVSYLKGKYLTQAAHAVIQVAKQVYSDDKA